MTLLHLYVAFYLCFLEKFDVCCTNFTHAPSEKLEIRVLILGAGILVVSMQPTMHYSQGHGQYMMVSFSYHTFCSMSIPLVLFLFICILLFVL